MSNQCDADTEVVNAHLVEKVIDGETGMQTNMEINSLQVSEDIVVNTSDSIVNKEMHCSPPTMVEDSEIKNEYSSIIKNTEDGIG